MWYGQHMMGWRGSWLLGSLTWMLVIAFLILGIAYFIKELQK